MNYILSKFYDEIYFINLHRGAKHIFKSIYILMLDHPYLITPTALFSLRKLVLAMVCN